MAFVNSVPLIAQNSHCSNLVFRLIWTVIAMGIGGVVVRRAQTALERGANQRYAIGSTRQPARLTGNGPRPGMHKCAPLDGRLTVTPLARRADGLRTTQREG